MVAQQRFGLRLRERTRRHDAAATCAVVLEVQSTVATTTADRKRKPVPRFFVWSQG